MATLATCNRSQRTWGEPGFRLSGASASALSPARTAGSWKATRFSSGELLITGSQCAKPSKLPTVSSVQRAVFSMKGETIAYIRASFRVVPARPARLEITGRPVARAVRESRPSDISMRSESPNWMEPAPTSASASATARNSSGGAAFAGSRRFSKSMWRRLRSEDRPRAPARMPSRTISFICSICSGVATAE